MCLITIAPSGVKTLDWETLEYSHKRNDDGFGFAWYQDGIWHAVRRLEPFESLQRALSIIPDDAPVVIHQRMSTKGSVSIYNTHPFDVGGALLFHNGSISDTGAEYEWSTGEMDDKGDMIYKKRDWSDTNAFAQKEIMPLLQGKPERLKEWWAKKFIEARIGWSNVVVCVIDGDPDPVIYNEKRGDWVPSIKDDKDSPELYYSNSYSRPGKSGYNWGSSQGSDNFRSGYGFTSGYGADYCEADVTPATTLQDAAAKQYPPVETDGDEQGLLEAPETGDKAWAEMTTDEKEAWTAYLEQEYGLEKGGFDIERDADEYIAYAQYMADDANWDDADDFGEEDYYRMQYGYVRRKKAI